ncbi:MAG: TIGR01777 family protein [Planctomycetota bacterium]|nr:MAG: TIGR01777 family protein [Planctomycetota bacterium]
MTCIAIVGGTGLVGRALIETARAQGHRLRIAVRSHTPDWLLQLSQAAAGDCTTFSWQGGDAPFPGDEVRGCDALINLAGASIGDGRWTARRRELLRSSRIDTTVSLAAICRDASIPVLVNASGVAIYGLHAGEVDEEAPAHGEDFLAQLAQDWEAAALQAAPTTRVVLLRLGMVLSGQGSALQRIVPPWLPRFVPLVPLAGGRQGLPWIHLDVAASMLLAAATDAAWRGAVNGVAPDVATNAAFTRAAAAASGHFYFPLGPPALALRVALGRQADLVLADIRAIPKRAQAWNFAWRWPNLAMALENCLGNS